MTNGLKSKDDVDESVEQEMIGFVGDSIVKISLYSVVKPKNSSL